MNKHIENILERPTLHKVGILCASVAFIITVFWTSFISPVFTELSEIDKKINGADGYRIQIATQEGIAANLDSFREEVAKLDVELKKALQQLPNEKEIDDLLSQVSTLGRDAGLDIGLFKPQAEKKKDYYAEVPVEMEIAGTYHQIATFFDEVGHLDRIVNLDEFRMTEPKVGEEQVALKGSVVATTFRFLREEERPKVTDKSGKRRRAPSKEKDLNL